MDWRKLKVGQTVWHVNTSPWDYDSPHPSSCLELWKGTVKIISEGSYHPVECDWDRVGGHANWVKPEWGWTDVSEGLKPTTVIPGQDAEPCYENPHIFPTAEEAIEAYLASPRKKLMWQAVKLKGK